MLNSVNNRSNITQDKDAKVAELKKAQNMFFKLLTTQLQCQDIDSTVDMNQMTQQIFQMNELQTLIAMDHKLDEINTSIKSSNDVTTASNMIGKYALTEANSITVSLQDKVIPISYVVDGPGEVDGLMQVVDDKGNVIHEAKLDKIPCSSMQNFELNFKNQDGSLSVEEGIYKVNILAYDKSDMKPLLAQIYTPNKIQQATNKGEFIMSNNQKIQLGDIISLQDIPSIITHKPSEKQKGIMTMQDLLSMKATTTT